MLRRLMELFTESTPEESEETRHDRLRIATCAVLLEAAHIDEDFSHHERAHIITVLRVRFELSDEEAHDLLEAATQSREESVDLWSFTHTVNEHCTREEKITITEKVWRVIYSDGALAAHEDHLVHRIAKLFNLRHPELIDAKLRVLKEIRGAD